MLPEIPEGVAWSILLLPIGSLLAILLLTRPNPRLSGYATIAAIGTAFLFSLWALDSSIDSDGAALAFRTHEWLTITPPAGADLARWLYSMPRRRSISSGVSFDVSTDRSEPAAIPSSTPGRADSSSNQRLKYGNSSMSWPWLSHPTVHG